MIAFLGTVLASVLEWVITKLIGLGVVEFESIKAKLKIASDAKTDAANLSNAKTDEEQKAALTNIDRDIFGS
jgi:hypothetical protein